MLLDSNIVIYSHKAEYKELRDFIRKDNVFISAITCLETLGYHQISNQEKEYLQRFFAVVTILPISDAVIQNAIMLRQQRNISVGDALIASTALLNNLTLVTRNTKDFAWIYNLKLLNPIDQQHSS
jgi:predicted nucleic acid-binding protein